MNLENNIPQFNIESFNKDFKSILENYLSNIDSIRHIKPLIKSNEGMVDSTEYRNKLDSEIKENLSNLISITIKSFKLTNNKEEVLNVISSTFLELVDECDDVDALKEDFYQKIILELAKTQK